MRMNLRNKLIFGTIWAFLGQGATLLFGLLSTVLLARLLDSSDLGVFFIASSLVVIVSAIAQLGLGKAASREIGRAISLGNPREAWWYALTASILAIASVILVCSALMAFGYQFLALNVFASDELLSIEVIVVSWMALFALRNVMLDMYRGFHDIRSTVLFGEPLTKTLFAVALLCVWALDYSIELRTALWILVISIGATLLLGSLRLVARSRQLQGSLNLVSLQPLLRVALPLLVINLTNMAYGQVNIWIVSAFQSNDQVALFGAAMRLAVFVSLPLVVISSIMPPIIAGLFAQGDKRKLSTILQLTATMTAIPAFFLTVAISIYGREILELFYGVFYVDAYPILFVLSIGYFITVLAGLAGLSLSMTAHQNLTMLINITGLAGMVIGGIYAGPRYGALGVAIVSTCVVSAVSLFSAAVCHRILNVDTYATAASLRDSDFPYLVKAIRDRFQGNAKR